MAKQTSLGHASPPRSTTPTEISLEAPIRRGGAEARNVVDPESGRIDLVIDFTNNSDSPELLEQHMLLIMVLAMEKLDSNSRVTREGKTVTVTSITKEEWGLS